MQICVYGAAQERIAEYFKKEVTQLGRELSKNGHTLIYGGGCTGLMGAVARGFLDENGEVTAVTPHFMHTFQPVLEEATHTIETTTMSERKQIMEDHADAFIIVPGGIGTLDEFFQILTLKELQRTNKPILLFNIDHFYDPLIAMIEHYHDLGFVRDIVKDCYHICNKIEEIIEQLNTGS